MLYSILLEVGLRSLMLQVPVHNHSSEHPDDFAQSPLVLPRSIVLVRFVLFHPFAAQFLFTFVFTPSEQIK